MSSIKISSVTPLIEILDSYGDQAFKPNEVEALNSAGFYVLQDLFFIQNTRFPLSRMDTKAQQAQLILDDLNPNSNSTSYRLNEIYTLWRGAIEDKKARVYEDATKAVSLDITAPVTRNSRLGRVFKIVSRDELLDTVVGHGRRRPTDRGYAGLKTNLDDFGYNG